MVHLADSIILQVKQEGIENIEKQINELILSSSKQKISLSIDVKDLSKQAEMLFEGTTNIDAPLKAIDRSVKEITDKLIQEFNIGSRAIKKELIQAVQEYQEAIKIDDTSKISESYEKIFSSIESGARKSKEDIALMEDMYRSFLSTIESYKGGKIRVEPFGSKEDFNAMINSVGVGMNQLFTTVKGKGTELDSVFVGLAESFSHFLDINTAPGQDQLEQLIDVILKARNAIKETSLTDRDIDNIYGVTKQ